ncbi:MAG: ATP-grasp domain-containing protein [Elusimicrobiota bacterium]
MRIAVVFNRDSKKVINLFGVPNREKYGLANIRRILDALKAGGHQAKAFEGDKDLIDTLGAFMPRVLKGERPGMVFNLSYGIQGQARYTHVPSILEMVGIPYVGSGPLAHSLALDKVVAKMLFRQHGLPTPDFAVIQDLGADLPELPFPLIVKPKNEAVSFGLRIVRNKDELREGAEAIVSKFAQPALVERYIEGREINVGVLGNSPAEALPPAELVFGTEGPPIYTHEDKTRKSGREIGVVCPAELTEELAARAKELGLKAFSALGCYDCARIDMRLDKEGNLFILEVNSLPSLGEHGSFVEGAKAAGLDFTALINRLVEVASARYFGTPKPPSVDVRTEDPQDAVFAYLTDRRDHIERRLQDWTAISSRTGDPVGLHEASREVERLMAQLGLKPVAALSDERSVRTWQTKGGLQDGILFLGHLDVPVSEGIPHQPFRRETEQLFGEGVGCSRAPLVMLEFALRALRQMKRLRGLKLGVAYYFDEGRDCRYSADILRKACSAAKKVLILRPGGPEDCVITQRRGQRSYRISLEGKPRRLSWSVAKGDPLRWLGSRLERIASFSSSSKKVAAAVVSMDVKSYPLYLPHRLTAALLMSYLLESEADRVEAGIRDLVEDGPFDGRMSLVAERPSMLERRASAGLLKAFTDVASKWEIPIRRESSALPSAGGYVPRSKGVLCGVGPVAADLYTPQESVSRISLVQRTLLLAEFLARELGD